MSLPSEIYVRNQDSKIGKLGLEIFKFDFKPTMLGTGGNTAAPIPMEELPETGSVMVFVGSSQNERVGHAKRYCTIGYTTITSSGQG